MPRVGIWRAERVATFAAALLISLIAAGNAATLPNSDESIPISEGKRAALVGLNGTVAVNVQAASRSGVSNVTQMESEASVRPRVLRMQGSGLKDSVPVSCVAADGVREIRLPLPASVPDSTAQARTSQSVDSKAGYTRRDCERSVATQQAAAQDEHRDPGTYWPQTPWDVRTVRAGGTLTADEPLALFSDGVTLSSPAFVEPVVMHGGKTVSAVVHIRCTAPPGLYTVTATGPGAPAGPWARFRVEPALPNCHDPAPARAAGSSGHKGVWLGAAAFFVFSAIALIAVLRFRPAA